MMRLLLLASLLGLATLAVLPAPTSSCSPPCGPIPVIIDIKLEKFRNLTFGDANELALPGTVAYYVDVDRDGFYYDKDHRPMITFRINKQPPWVNTTIAPDRFEVPVDDTRYLTNEGEQPGEVQFLWSASIRVTVEKVRDPTVDELKTKWLRSDGTYRVSVGAVSTASLAGGGAAGGSMGLQEGYGVRELRFLPEIELDQETVDRNPWREAPAPPFWAWAGLLCVFAAMRRRRRG